MECQRTGTWLDLGSVKTPTSLAYYVTVKEINESTISTASSTNQDDSRLAIDCKAAPGHYDELHGGLSSQVKPSNSNATESIADFARPAGVWSQFFNKLPDLRAANLNQRQASLDRQIRDNGVTYNVYSDENGPQRPWSLDLFPLIIDTESWQQIEAGILQRMKLLERVITDVYGPQELLKQGLLPPALVNGHPGYLRAMHGVKPVGGTHLHVAAFDLARGPDGHWWVVSQRCQAPSGLGYLLENRLAFPNLARSETGRNLPSPDGEPEEDEPGRGRFAHRPADPGAL